MGKLTAAFCKNVKTVGRHFDGGGLYLHVKANGRKYWRYSYRFNGKANIFSCGVYPRVSLAQARVIHAIARSKLDQGIDPNAEKREAKAAKQAVVTHSFKKIAFDWLEATRQTRNWSEKHYKDTKANIKNHILPTFGECDISAITALDVMNCVREIDESGKNSTAHYALDNIKRIFRYAVVVQLIPYSPAESLRDILRPEQPTPMLHTLEPERIGEILLQIDRAITTLPAVRAYMQILPMVFCRPSELRCAKWEYLDFEEAILTIPAEKMKRRRPYTIPLPSQAMIILKVLQLHTFHTGFIFANTARHAPISDGAAGKFRHTTGMNLDTTSHGWRHTASTLLHERGYNSDFIEMQLSHKDKNTTRGTYNHAQYLDDRRAMLQAWADYLEGLKMAAFERERAKYQTKQRGE